MGPTGWTVAKNLGRLREKRGLSLRALSAVLAEAGQPINPDGLNRAEKGMRQVTTDELVALAAALDVSPNGILFPVDARGVVDVSGIKESISVEELWEWAEGRTPLSDQPDEDGDWADEFMQFSRPSFLAKPDMQTRAGRRRFGKTVDGQPGWDVHWTKDGEIESIQVNVYGKWRSWWPEKEDDDVS